MDINPTEFNPEVAILRKGMLSLYKDDRILNEDVGWFRNRNYRIYFVEFETITTVDHFHECISRALEFPNYYGKNMNAFEDSLCELNLDSFNGGLLVFRRYDRFMRAFRDFAVEVLDIVANVSRLYLVDGKKLITLIQTNETNLSIPKVGGYFIDSNSREAFLTN